jgi:dihydroorotate dehydrogenase/Pyruvate/2-oxoacid:ferredoxin oxidoreductase delta subunit
MSTELERLGTELAGVKMRTPVGLGAIVEADYRGKKTPEEWAEMILKTVGAGVGQVTIATISYITPEEEKRLTERVRAEEEEYRVPMWERQKPPIYPNTDYSKIGFYSNYGFQGVGQFFPGIRMDPSSRGKEEMKKAVMAILKERLPDDVPIIGSVTGYGSTPEGWLPCVKAAEQWGADLIELNASCPFPAGFAEYVDWYIEERWPARYPGPGLLLRPNLFERIVKEAVKAVSVPVGIKFSPEIGFPECIVLARRYRDAGARYITTLNSAITIIPPDIYNRGKPRTPHLSGNIICGANGPFLRLANYKMVGSIARFVPGLDIMAIGGIEEPEHVIEFLMLGANAVQQVTAPMLKGRRLFRREIAFLKDFLEEQGYGSVREFIGLHQPYLTGSEMVYTTEEVKYIAETDVSLCDGCGTCVDMPTCMASEIIDKKGIVDPERCEGCGWCVYGCPKRARKMVRTAGIGALFRSEFDRSKFGHEH